MNRHTFSDTVPTRRSTLNVFSAAAAEEAEFINVTAPRKRSSMTTIERFEHEHQDHML